MDRTQEMLSRKLSENSIAQSALQQEVVHDPDKVMLPISPLSSGPQVLCFSPQNNYNYADGLRAVGMFLLAAEITWIHPCTLHPLCHIYLPDY